MKIRNVLLSIKNGNFFEKVYRKFGKIELLRNNVIINKANQDKCYRKYKKKYKYVIESFNYDDSLKQEQVKIVWVFWYQGLKNAPMIIKKCIESQKKYLEGYTINIITKENIKDFVSLPEYILEKFNDGIISYTHFSDILRISLLSEHGGIWLDSTVLLTDRLPEYITDSPFFVYKSIELDRSDTSQLVASSWLISSYTNQKISLLTRNLLYEYWKKENKLDDYFLFHILFKYATENCQKEWKMVPTYSNINPHILYFEFLDGFDENRFKDILKISSVHKLNRKTVNENKNLYTYYDYIIEHDI